MKYKNTRCACHNGHIHMSRLEARHCDVLHMGRRSMGVKDIQTQAKFPLVVNGKLIATHYVDFLLTYKDGHQEAVESKGFATDVWKIKQKLFEALYPEVKYNVWRRGG